MNGQALVMAIDFGINRFNAIHLNNQLKLIARNGRMITIEDTTHLKVHEESTCVATNLFDFFKQ